MKIGVPREIAPGERRVALVPETVSKLAASGFEVLVETGAGERAFFPDRAYQDAGATVVPNAAALFGGADAVLKVQKPSREEVALLKPGSVLIGLLQPLTNPELVRWLLDERVTSFSMDLVPRITRAQKMDALSSMATVAGYKAVLLAAAHLGRFFPMLTTAAGTIPPARAFILGAGVAGLQAIATARRLGAVVEAFDTRPAVKEQVQSLGATFVEIELDAGEMEDAGGYARELSEDHVRREQELIRKHLQEADIVITTAQIPGRRAPLLITSEMVTGMKPGSVIIDLAAEGGGNCALTKVGEQVAVHGVLILGPLNLPSTMPVHASQMYSRNISSLWGHLVKDRTFNFDWNDQITAEACATHDGRPVNKAVQALLSPAGSAFGSANGG